MAQINILMKLLSAAGVNINPATEDTLTAIGDVLALTDFATDAKLEAVRLLLANEDFASETTLARRFAKIAPFSFDVAAAGTQEVAAPTSGKRLIVTWLHDQAVGALGAGYVEVKWKFDSAAGGSGVWKYLHENTGSQPFSHGMWWEGAVDEKLYVSINANARVIGNADTKEY